MYINTGVSRFGGPVHIDAGQILHIGDTSNANMSTGININQTTADNELFCAKSSDFGHGFTAITEADSYFTMRKANGSLGGVEIAGFGSSPMAALTSAVPTPLPRCSSATTTIEM